MGIERGHIPRTGALGWCSQADAQDRPAVSKGTGRDLILRKAFEENAFMVQQMKDRAQGLVEYGLIIALVAVLAIAGLIIFGPAVSSLLSKLGGSV
jgi:Flp pilus assembly pilin Flp